MAGVKARIIEVAKLMDPYPVSCEVTTNDREGMLTQAKDIASWAKNINVRSPSTAPMANWTICPSCMSWRPSTYPRQCHRHDECPAVFLAALAGATYVSILSGRVNNMGYDSVAEIETLRLLLDDHDLKPRS